jgi:hypothetical protein
MSVTKKVGRLGNQIIRNLAVNILAKKHDLLIFYCNKELIESLGLNLFSGENSYNNTIVLNDDNYFSILSMHEFKSNINPNVYAYFQTKEITNMIYNYIKTPPIKKTIIEKNPFKYRYNSNNDLFIHIRLSDASKYNAGLEYYIKSINNITFNKLYVSSDDVNHSIIKNLIKIYPSLILVKYKEVKTIQFASTCKHIILSHGSFSAIIGYLGFFSHIYYPEYEKLVWCGDMFSIPGWNKIKI